MHARALLAAPLFLLFLSPVVRAADEPLRPAVAAADVPVGVDWYGVYAQSAKIGWVRMELTRKGDVFVRDDTGMLDFAALKQPLTMELAEHFEFDAAPPYALRSARSNMKQAGVEMNVELTKTQDGWRAVVTQGGQSHEPPVTGLDYTLADALGPELWFQAPRAKGDTARFRSFSLTELESDVERITVDARKESVVQGVPTVFYEATQKSEKKGETTRLRVDGKGTLISLFIGQIFEARLESEEDAKKPGKRADVFVMGLARIDQPIGDAPNVRRLVLEVQGQGAESLADAPRQSVTRDPATGAVTLTLGDGAGKEYEATPAEIEEALAETVKLPIKSRDVVDLANTAVGDAKTPREKVERLVKFVSDYLADEIDMSPVSVGQIIKNKKGDCSEHARLFAALARASGVPAREVSGVMYMGDDVRAFGGHAWNEVVIDGKWAPVDPAWNEIVLDGAHVVLDREDASMDHAATLGAIKFKLKDVVKAPQTVPPPSDAPK